MAKKQVVVEEMVFENYEDAVLVKENAEFQIEQIDSCKTLAIIGTVCGAIGWLPIGPTGYIWLASIVIACVCYAKVKCFGGAFRWGINLAKVAYFLCPLFPLDLMLAAGGLMFGFFGFLSLPYLALRGIRKQAVEELGYANDYLKKKQVETQAN